MSLKAKKNTETNVWELEVSISGEDFEKAVQKAYNKQKSKIAIPGFRKGKVPRNMIEARYGKNFFYEDALDDVYGPNVEAAVKEAELDVVGTKNVDIKEIGPEGVELVVSFYVKPEIELTAYKELKATKKKVEATDDEINTRIDQLRERNARMIGIEDRAVQENDIAVIDYEGFMDGVAFEGGKGEGYELTIGSNQFIPGFEDQIIGHNISEEFDINVTFPEEYHEELAGKEATFHIVLHEIKVKELPELNDEFAQEANDSDTVDDLKKSIANEIKENKEHENEHDIEQQLLDKLAENVVGEIPECMVDTEIDNEIRNIEYRLSSQGLDFETYLGYMGMSRDDYREQSKENAEKQVKIHLAVEKIIELENIDATEEEIEEEYKKYAEQYGMEIEKIKEIVPADSVKPDIKATKALKLVKDNAKVTTARKPKAKADEETADAE